MPLSKIAIETTNIAVPIFENCNKDTALSVIDTIMRKDENDVVITKAKAVVMSTTGLSKAIAKIITETYGQTIHIHHVQPTLAVEQEIVNRSNNLLSNCDTVFSEHSEEFDAAMFAFGSKVVLDLNGLYTRSILKPGDSVVVLMERFLLAAFSDALATPFNQQVIDGTEGSENVDNENERFV